MEQESYKAFFGYNYWIVLILIVSSTKCMTHSHTSTIIILDAKQAIYRIVGMSYLISSVPEIPSKSFVQSAIKQADFYLLSDISIRSLALNESIKELEVQSFICTFE
jgi:hypothetical protein